MVGGAGVSLDGGDVTQVWEEAQKAFAHVRAGRGPFFLRASCVHLEGHFLGYQLIRTVRNPLREMPRISLPLTKSMLHTSGAPWSERLEGLGSVLAAVIKTLRDPRRKAQNDPVRRTREALKSDETRLRRLEDDLERQIRDVVDASLEGMTVW